jgi:FtsP/CotA-like multicopper oxidase with cupredoxin domain
MITRRIALLGAAAAALIVATPALAADDLKLPRQTVELVAPPFVHPHEQATKEGPKIIEFKLTIKEEEGVIDEAGTKFQAMTFNGSMPGPLMVVHEGDYVEVTLVNPETNAMPHNIDFHAATGALGGGALTHVSPGEQVVLRWKATRTGTFVYHCAPEGMIPWHVVSGMHGTVMVLPRDGLKNREGKALRYDRLYYVGENDLYVPKDEKGKYKTYETVGESFADTTEVMRNSDPRRVQRQSRRPHRQECDDGEGRRDRHDRSLAGQPRHPSASDRRPRRLRLGDRQVHQPAGEGSRDLVHPWWFGGRCALHVQAARHLRLRQPQFDRGHRTRRQRPLQGRRRMEQRPHEAGAASRTDPARQVQRG